MEAVIGQITGSAGGVAGIFFLSKLLSWWYRRRVSGLVLLKGKTTICNELSSDKLLFLDLDMLMEKMPNFAEANKSKSDMVLLHTALKEMMDKLLRAYQKPIVFVSRHHDLLKVLGLKRKKIYFVCGSKEAHKKAELMYKDPAQFASDEAERLRLLQQIKEKNVKVYDNLSEVKNIVKRLFKLEDNISL